MTWSFGAELRKVICQTTGQAGGIDIAGIGTEQLANHVRTLEARVRDLERALALMGARISGLKGDLEN